MISDDPATARRAPTARHPAGWLRRQTVTLGGRPADGPGMLTAPPGGPEATASAVDLMPGDQRGSGHTTPHHATPRQPGRRRRTVTLLGCHANRRDPLTGRPADRWRPRLRGLSQMVGRAGLHRASQPVAADGSGDSVNRRCGPVLAGGGQRRLRTPGPASRNVCFRRNQCSTSTHPARPMVSRETELGCDALGAGIEGQCRGLRPVESSGFSPVVGSAGVCGHRSLLCVRSAGRSRLSRRRWMPLQLNAGEPWSRGRRRPDGKHGQSDVI